MRALKQVNLCARQKVQVTTEERPWNFILPSPMECSGPKCSFAERIFQGDKARRQTLNR